MVRRTYDTFEAIRRKAGMGERLGAKDHEYGDYAGASFELGEKMATVDTMLKNGLIPKDMVPLVKLYRSFLNQHRKAFFAGVGCDVITKLGMMLGVKDDTIRF